MNSSGFTIPFMIRLSPFFFYKSEKRPEQGKPIFEKDGIQFSAGMKYSHSEREEFLTNKNDYIGLTAEVRFFEWTDEKLPRFPVMVGIRNDK